VVDDDSRARARMIARRIEVGRAAMDAGDYELAELIFREAAGRFESTKLAQLADEAHAAAVAQPRQQREQGAQLRVSPDVARPPQIDPPPSKPAPQTAAPTSPVALGSAAGRATSGTSIPRRDSLARPRIASASKAWLVGGIAIAAVFIAIGLSRLGGSTTSSAPTMAERTVSPAPAAPTAPASVPPSSAVVPPSPTAVPPSSTAVPPSPTAVPPSPTAAPPSSTVPPPSTAPVVTPAPTVPKPQKDVKPVAPPVGTPVSAPAPRREDRPRAASTPAVPSSGAVPTPTPTTSVPGEQRQSPATPQSSERLTRARRLVEGRSFTEAIAVLTDLQKDNPDDPRVTELLSRARDELRTSVQQEFLAAVSSETSGDWPAALQHYERVRQLDPAMAAVTQALNRVRARMKTEGADALRNARQYDAVDRVADAITWYERAYRYLPDDDPGRKIAKERLDVLRARPR
jgi:tetratricopeptide (TPR) repeat protein